MSCNPTIKIDTWVKSDNNICLNCDNDAQLTDDPKHRLATCTSFFDIHDTDKITQFILDNEFNTRALERPKDPAGDSSEMAAPQTLADNGYSPRQHTFSIHHSSSLHNTG